MQQSAKKGSPATTGSVLIVGCQEERTIYLRNILEFIDFSLLVADAAPACVELLQDAPGVVSAVFIGPDVDAKTSREIVRALEQEEFSLPFFQLRSVNGRQRKEKAETVGRQFIGELSLPCRYEELMNAMHKAQLYRESQHSDGEAARPLELFRSLSGNSRATRRINRMIEQVADTEATVLILGESGTGKEVVARKLHYHSGRRGMPFVPVNCGAIPSELLESELFGHEKGAFTGAISSRQGRFELAEGGTLFLDEIGDMSLPMQVKLLRVLQERTFERVGSNKTIACNVRIVAATHRDLEEAIRQERFREDLYYRLNVFPIEMAPLRERVDDIPVLVADLIARIEREKRGSVRLTPAAVAALTQYPWPGNVRELANLIERLAILYPYGIVDVKELPEKFRAGIDLDFEHEVLDQDATISLDSLMGSEQGAARLPEGGVDLKAHLNNMELALIRQALSESGGVVAHAAKRLKMRRTTLVEKLRKFGLQRATESPEI